MTEDAEIEMLRKLDALRLQHRKIDSEIYALSAKNSNDQFTLHRLKKEKLCLRDQIAAIEEVLYPDIIA